jgi:hypothetical protein
MFFTFVAILEKNEFEVLDTVLTAPAILFIFTKLFIVVYIYIIEKKLT